MDNPGWLPRYTMPVLAMLTCAACASLEKEPPGPAEFVENALSGDLAFETAGGQEATATLQWSQWASQPFNDAPTRRADAAITPIVPNYRWCVSRSGRTHGSDRCYDFETGTLQCTISDPSALRRSRDCTGVAKIPPSLAGTTGWLYVRAEDPGNVKSYTNSETRAYSWTVLKPDLEPDDASESINGDVVTLRIHAYNRGPVDANNVTMRFTGMRIVDANDATHNLTQGDLQYPEVPANNGVTQAITVDTAPLNLTRPFTLSLTMTLDPDNAVDESDETNNSLTWNHTFF